MVLGKSKSLSDHIRNAVACSRPRNDKRCSTALEKIQDRLPNQWLIVVNGG